MQADQDSTAAADNSNSKPFVIPIKTTQSDIPEWAMLELNGELILPTVVATKTGDNIGSAEQQQQSNNEFHHILGPDGVELGLLKFRDKKTPILIIGSHELKGTIQTLAQPFLVMEREEIVQPECQNSTSNEDVDEVVQDNSNESSAAAIALRVVGVVKQKLLFQSYPKSILR